MNRPTKKPKGRHIRSLNGGKPVSAASVREHLAHCARCAAKDIGPNWAHVFDMDRQHAIGSAQTTRLRRCLSCTSGPKRQSSKSDAVSSERDEPVGSFKYLYLRACHAEHSLGVAKWLVAVLIPLADIAVLHERERDRSRFHRVHFCNS